MCDCIKRINDLLKPRNTELELAIFFDGSATRPILAVDKLDKKQKGKPTNIMAAYCPFCGEKYPKAITSEEIAINEDANGTGSVSNI